MAKLTPAYTDNAGKLHPSLRECVLADLSAVLGRLGGDAGIVAGVAQVILDKRADIMTCFAEFDELDGSANPSAEARARGLRVQPPADAGPRALAVAR